MFAAQKFFGCGLLASLLTVNFAFADVNSAVPGVFQNPQKLETNEEIYLPLQNQNFQPPVMEDKTSALFQFKQNFAAELIDPAQVLELNLAATNAAKPSVAAKNRHDSRQNSFATKTIPAIKSATFSLSLLILSGGTLLGLISLLIVRFVRAEQHLIEETRNFR